MPWRWTDSRETANDEAMTFSLSLTCRRRLALCILLFVVTVAAGRAAARSPISLEALRRDGYGSVDLVKNGQNRLYVPAMINGEKIGLLLDTGWGGEGITLGVRISDLHIVPEKGTTFTLTAGGNRVAMGHGIADSVRMGNVQIQHVPVYFGKVAVTGVVSHGFLKRNSAIIDLTNLRLYLRPPGKGRRVNLDPALTAMGLAKAHFTDAPHGSYVLNVEINGVPTEMALDTGAQVTVLDPRFATKARTTGWSRRDIYQIDAAGAKREADYAGTKTFKIDGIPIRTPAVAVSHFAGYDQTHGKMVGVLGLDVLGLNWGIIDIAQQKFYFTRGN